MSLPKNISGSHPRYAAFLIKSFASTILLVSAKIYVNPDQRPLAIGKNGQNVRLASRLTGYELDILDIAEMTRGDAQAGEKVAAIKDLPNISAELIEKLETANMTMVEQLKGLSVADLAGIEGVSEDEAQLLAEEVSKAS
jgi:N utilization substance protein A